MATSALRLVGFGILLAACSAAVDGPQPSTTETHTRPPRPVAPVVAPPTASPRRTAAMAPWSGGMQARSASIVGQQVHGSTGDDFAMAIAAGPSGVVVAGTLGGDADVGCGVHATAAFAAYVAAYNAGGACTWATYFDGDDEVVASAIAVGPDGAVYVAGDFAGTTVFGGSQKTSAGGTDGFVAKLSAAGAVAWGRTFGGTNDEYVYAVAANATRVVVGGAFYGAPVIGGAAFTNQGDADGFLVSWTQASGDFVASRAFGGTGWDALYALTFNAGGGVVAAGTIAGDVDLGTGTLASLGGQDAFVAVYDGSLAAIATRRLGGAGGDAAGGVVVDATARVIIAGYFEADADVGATAHLTGVGKHTGFWSAYGSDLSYLAAGTMDADNEVIGEGIALTSAGFVVAGRVTGTAQFGSQTIATGVLTAGFVASYLANGDLAWAVDIAGNGNVDAFGVAVSSGVRFVVGAFDGFLGRGPSAAPSAGGWDTFLVGVAP